MNRRKFVTTALGLAGSAAVSMATPGPGLGADGGDAFDVGLEAQTFMEQGQYRHAILILKRAVARWKDNSWLWSMLGRAHMGASQPLLARAAFERVLDLTPADAHSRRMVEELTSHRKLSELEELALEERRNWLEAQHAPVNNGLGFQVRRVVLDPGHGGFDPGAVGPSGVREKDVVLEIGRGVKRYLERVAPSMAVFMTRTNDYFLPLDVRTTLANRWSADLFVSLHANAATRHGASGLETYSCSEQATTAYAAEIARRENRELGKQEQSALERGLDMEQVLFRFERHKFWNVSRKVAGRVQQSMLAELQLNDRGVQAAGFRVLRTARMPAVLVESGFVSNPAEEQFLASAQGQDQVARSVAGAILSMAQPEPETAQGDV